MYFLLRFSLHIIEVILNVDLIYDLDKYISQLSFKEAQMLY